MGFVSMTPKGGMYASPESEYVRAEWQWERYSVATARDGQVSFLSVHRRYLTVSAEGTVAGTVSDNIADAMLWTVNVVEASIIADLKQRYQHKQRRSQIDTSDRPDGLCRTMSDEDMKDMYGKGFALM